MKHKKETRRLTRVIIVIMIAVVFVCLFFIVFIFICQYSFRKQAEQSILVIEQINSALIGQSQKRVALKKELCRLGDMGYVVYLYEEDTSKHVIDSGEAVFIQIMQGGITYDYLCEQDSFSEDVLQQLTISENHEDGYFERKREEHSHEVSTMSLSYCIAMDSYYLKNEWFRPDDYRLIQYYYYSRYNDARPFMEMHVMEEYDMQNEQIDGWNQINLIDGVYISDGPFRSGGSTDKMGQISGVSRIRRILFEDEYYLDLTGIYPECGQNMRLYISRL